jgi:CAP-Gly domain-containing linker protein 1
MYGLFTPVHKLAVVSDVEQMLPVPAHSLIAGHREPTTARRQDSSSPLQQLQQQQLLLQASPSRSKEGSMTRLDARSSGTFDKAEPGTQRMEDSNTAATTVLDNDEISRRLKHYVEKLESDKTELSHQLQDEKRKNEDLQFTLEEAGIEKSDLEAHLEKATKQCQELEERLAKETQLTDRLSKELAGAKGKSSGELASVSTSDEAIDEYLDQIEELTHKLSVAENKLKTLQAAPSSSVAVVPSGLCEKCQKLMKTGADVVSSNSQGGTPNTETVMMKAELERLRKEQCELEKVILDMKKDIHTSQLEKETLTKRNNQLLSHRDALTAERDQAFADNSLLQRKLKEAENLLNDLRQKAEQMEAAHVSQTSELRRRLEGMQAESEKLLKIQLQLLPYKQQVEQLASTVDTLSNERESLRQKLNELQATVRNHEQLESQHAASQAQIQEMKSKFMQMSKDVELEKAKLLDIVESTKKAVQLKEKEIEHFKSEVQRLKGENSQLKTAKSTEQETQFLQQRVTELEKTLNELQSNTDTGNVVAKLRTEKEAAESQVHFLNAVIVEIQRKNVELEAARRQSMTTSNGPINGHFVGIHGTDPGRLYCDICNVFDLHDTEDCPQQEMPVSSTSEDQSSEEPTY